MQTLRTAKLALEEELINQDDFNVIKTAFLKAQQIKAGIDAGFLREEDYVQARDSFLQSLDFEVSSQQQPAHVSTSVHSGHRPVPAPFAAPVTATRVQKVEARSAISAPGSPPERLQPHAQTLAPPPTLLAAAASATPQGRSLNGHSNGSEGGAPELNDLARLVRPGIVAGKKSMSGITVDENCINVFNHIKTRSTFKWVMYKIDDAGKNVVVETVGPSSSTYADFTAAIPALQCRYGVYDYAVVNADTQQTINKLVFVSWAPDTASTRTKMMYASTKDFFKNFLDGIGAEMQASDVQELEESEMKERIQQALTRK